MVDLPEGFIIVESTGPGGGKRVPPTLAQDLAGLGCTSLYDTSGKWDYSFQLMDNGINNLAEPGQLGSTPEPDSNDPLLIRAEIPIADTRSIAYLHTDSLGSSGHLLAPVLWPPLGALHGGLQSDTGATASAGLTAIQGNQGWRGSDILVCNYGINGSETAEDFRDAVLAIRDYVQSEQPGIKVVWVESHCHPDGLATVTERWQRKNPVLRSLIAEGEIDGLVPWETYAAAHLEIYSGDNVHHVDTTPYLTVIGQTLAELFRGEVRYRPAPVMVLPMGAGDGGNRWDTTTPISGAGDVLRLTIGGRKFAGTGQATVRANGPSSVRFWANFRGTDVQLTCTEDGGSTAQTIAVPRDQIPGPASDPTWAQVEWDIPEQCVRIRVSPVETAELASVRWFGWSEWVPYGNAIKPATTLQLGVAGSNNSSRDMELWYASLEVDGAVISKVEPAEITDVEAAQSAFGGGTVIRQAGSNGAGTVVTDRSTLLLRPTSFIELGGDSAPNTDGWIAFGVGRIHDAPAAAQVLLWAGTSPGHAQVTILSSGQIRSMWGAGTATDITDLSVANGSLTVWGIEVADGHHRPFVAQDPADIKHGAWMAIADPLPGPVRIGSSGSAGAAFQGEINAIAIADRVLSDPEKTGIIMALLNGGR